MQGETNKSTIIVTDFYFLIIDRSNRQNISKGIVNLKSTINQLGIVDIYRVLHAAREEYYSWACKNHSPIQAILGVIEI